MTIPTYTVDDPRTGEHVGTADTFVGATRLVDFHTRTRLSPAIIRPLKSARSPR